MPSSTGTLVFNDQKIQAPDIYATESLGVGVSDPTSNLQVVGNAYVTSNLEVGTANLFVDTTTGRVGVGTGSPSSKFHVSGPGPLYTTLSDTSAGIDAKNWWTSVNGNQMTHYLSNDANNASQPYMKINRSGYGVSSITFDYGNVGIGTTSPGATLDVNGHILNNNPAFYAYYVGGASTTTAYIIWDGQSGRPILDTTLINIGSCYNTSNGRFTAPVAGTYCFHGQALARQRSANNALEFTFYKNGTNVNARGMGYTLVVGTSDHDNLRIHAILALNANDYVQIGTQNMGTGVDFYYGEGLANFSGYLIG